MLALLVAPWGIVTRAQEAAQGRQPPDAQAAPQPEKELPADWKAFNDIANEKDLLKRAEAYEKFIKDYPQSELVTTARSQIQSTVLSVLKTSSSKYRQLITAQLETAKEGNPALLYSAYARAASSLLGAGVMLDEAENYARQALSLMDEQKYVQYRLETTKRAAEAFAKRAANPAATPAAPARPPMSITMVNGAPVVREAPPRPAPATPPPAPTAPRIPSEEQLRTSFKSERTSHLATLGQILVKNNKTAEGVKVLKEVFSANPSAPLRATVARALAESAKKAGDNKAMVDYMASVALTGNMTAAEKGDFEEAYRKTHNGSLQGLEEMLDARYLRDNPRFTPAKSTRNAAPNQRAVLAEDFTGAG
jgi:hypothetical protein